MLNLFNNKNINKRRPKKDMVSIKVFDINGQEIEKYTLSEDDWLDYFGILEAIAKTLKVKSEKIKEEGFNSEMDEQDFKKIETTIKKVEKLSENAMSITSLKILCFEGDKKEDDFITIKLFQKGKKNPDAIYIIQYREIEGYIKIINDIQSKLSKFSLPIKKKGKKKGKELIKHIVRKIENDISKIEILALKG